MEQEFRYHLCDENSSPLPYKQERLQEQQKQHKDGKKSSQSSELGDGNFTRLPDLSTFLWDFTILSLAYTSQLWKVRC